MIIQDIIQTQEYNNTNNITAQEVIDMCLQYDNIRDNVMLQFDGQEYMDIDYAMNTGSADMIYDEPLKDKLVMAYIKADKE